MTMSVDQRKIDMPRQKNTASAPTPRPVGNWLAGLMIGTAIMTMATHAMMLGVGAAIRDAASKDG
jgi:hypothetical protein